MKNEAYTTYFIKNLFKCPKNPKVRIIRHSNKNFIGITGELLYKGKEYSIIMLDNKNIITNDNKELNLPKYIYPGYRFKNDCFEIINN